MNPEKSFMFVIYTFDKGHQCMFVYGFINFKRVFN